MSCYTLSMLLVANWKAYVEDPKKAQALFSLSKRFARTHEVSIVLAPPSVFLGTLAAGNASRVSFAAQDVSATTGGAQTGEVTAQAYATAGATYAILGHSERRALGDTNAIVAEKVTHALAHGLTPILCIGEHERDTEGRYLSFLREQLVTALTPLTSKERQQVVVAYEPIWAIGKTASLAIEPSDLTEMVLYIRKILAGLLPGKSSLRTSVLYGGSVEPGNARALALHSGINGFLVGHASVDQNSFTQLVKEFA